MNSPKDQPKRSKRTHLWIAAAVAVTVHGAVVLTLLLTERPESAGGDFPVTGGNKTGGNKNENKNGNGNKNKNEQLVLSLLPPEQITKPSAAQQWVARQEGDGRSLGPPPRTLPPARTALRGEAMNSASRNLREAAEPALKRGGLIHTEPPVAWTQTQHLDATLPGGVERLRFARARLRVPGRLPPPRIYLKQEYRRLRAVPRALKRPADLVSPIEILRDSTAGSLTKPLPPAVTFQAKSEPPLPD